MGALGVISESEFRQALERAMADLPASVRNELKNIEIVVRDRPGEEASEAVKEGHPLLALYVGSSGESGGAAKARIYLYQAAFEERCGDDREWVAEEIQLALLRQVKRHLGMADDDGGDGGDDDESSKGGGNETTPGGESDADEEDDSDEE
ncbi:MAG: metallopeptidase family protein [Nitrospirae bacterium]|nr:metallopeptidase family protein [Nitrospirota bacterium]